MKKKFLATTLVISVLGLSSVITPTMWAGAEPAAAYKTSKAAVGTSGAQAVTLQGNVESDGTGLVGYQVSLYASYVDHGPSWKFLGSDTSKSAGTFAITYSLPPGLLDEQQPLLFVQAVQGSVMLASAIGMGSSALSDVVVNERTTVATGNAFAQFVDGARIVGNTYGMINAVQMAANLANPQTGAVGRVLALTPNGPWTSTHKTFNSLSNVVASCVASAQNCTKLFEAATPPGGSRPTNVLQAIANIVKNPSYPGYPSNSEDPVFLLSEVDPIYQPALTQRPTNWLLFLKFTGGVYRDYADTNLMNGPGNIAFDERGFAWINDNYVPQAEFIVACAGLRLMKFYPWGERFPDSPYFGGGLSGAGFGITLDPRGNIWVGNFGFEAPSGCLIPPDPAKKIPATHDSVSLFRPDGSPISGPQGFTEGHIWWPQGTVSDRKGNVWVASCGNDTVTFFPRGEQGGGRNIILPGGQGAMGHFRVVLPDRPLLKPFAIAIDPKGRAWVTANRAGHIPGTSGPAGRVYRILPDGTVETLPDTNGKSPESILRWPMGISGDSKGNMWVSNSDAVNVPCVTPLDPQDGDNPSIVLYPADGGSPKRYIGGGLTIPWGNTVDGNDTLWVFNFGQKPTKDVDENTTWPDTGVSHFCGADVSKCPAGLSTGDPISLEQGYTSDALDRVTGGGVDPSGNLWLLNNWKKTGPFPPVYDTNPGGNSFVIVPGAAAPIKTPLIGAPVAFK
jgi:hypothetical protein